MKTFLVSFSGLFAAIILLPGALAQDYVTLTPVSSFGGNGDGSVRAGDRPFLTTGNFQRGMAYNPVTGNIILVDRATSAADTNVTGTIQVINGLNGSDVGTLSTAGITGGAFADFAVAVSEDGVVYVGNVVTDGTAANFKLYRWESDFSVSGPVVAFEGDPGNGRPQRWGDTMDIRGAGANTQIILGSRTTGAVIGTNVAILTTTNGTNFTAITLSADVADSASGGGIAFGAGNTFWAKNLDVPLRRFSFDLMAGTATTSHSFGTNDLAASRTLEALVVDADNDLLAAVDTGAGADQVRLYDISNLAVAPSLLDVKSFPVNHANATTTKAYVDMGNSYLHVHSINNGLLALEMQFAFMPAPIIGLQPASQRVVSGRNVRFEVVAYPSATYQWQRNNTDIPGATSALLNITNVQTADAGTYKVIASNAGGATDSADAVLSVINPNDLHHLVPLWSAVPAAGNYVTSTGGSGTPNERFIAYNALSNHLYVIQRSAPSQSNFTVHVVDASTGTKLYNLNTNGIVLFTGSEVSGANGIGLVAIDVADDGAIYACNASPNAGGGSNPFSTNKLFRVYRWADGHSNTLPVQIFEGDPAGQTSNFRWGDVMDARGSGTNTQILLDNQNASTRFMAILRPTDEAMNTFSPTSFLQDTADPFGTSIGRTLEFGAGDTFWQKRKPTGTPPVGALLQSSFDLNLPNSISPKLAAYTNFPNGIGLGGLDLSRNLFAAINFVTVTTTPDTLDLYDISDPSNPLLLGQYNFPINHVANANFIGRVLFSGNKVFALSANNGIIAFTVASGPVSPPTISRQPQNLRLIVGTSGTLSVISADIATYQWQFNGANIDEATSASYTLSNVQTNNAGNYRVIVSNDAGSVTSAVAVVTVLLAQDFHHLSPLWSATPGSQEYVTSNGGSQTPNERQIAYNALSNQLYVVHRTGSGTMVGVNTIYVLNADNGALLYSLNTNGIFHEATVASGNSFLAINAIDVAADGSIYAASLTPDACVCLGTSVNSQFRLYRWANSHPDTLPVLVFQGEPAGQATALRWGDVLDVRGAGAGTEIIVDNNQGTFVAVLRPADETMNVFAPAAFPNLHGSGSIGRSLEFGAGNTIWQKRKATRLQLSGYDLNSQTSVVLTNQDMFPSTLGPVAVDEARKLIVGLDFSANATSPDAINLYDAADFNNLLLIGRYNFPENSRPNANFIGEVLIAGNRVFAVDGNNGLAAFTIVPPGGPPLNIISSGSDVILAWPESATGFVLQKTITLSPPDWQPVLQMPTVVNGQKTVTESTGSGNAFYRLRN